MYWGKPGNSQVYDNLPFINVPGLTFTIPHSEFIIKHSKIGSGVGGIQSIQPPWLNGPINPTICTLSIPLILSTKPSNVAQIPIPLMYVLYTYPSLIVFPDGSNKICVV